MKELYGIIYLTTCLVNNKVYVGQTINWQDKSYLGSGTAFVNALKKYGRKNFKRETLKLCYSQAQLDAWETVMVRKYDSTNPEKGYNILPGTANNFGQINPARLPEVQEKIKRKKAGKYKGKNCYWYGKELSDETKKKLSKAAKKRLSDPRNNPMYGKKQSEEARQKIANSRKGKPSPRSGAELTDETKEKLRKANIGKRVINNGVENKVINVNDTLPKGWNYGRCKKEK